MDGRWHSPYPLGQANSNAPITGDPSFDATVRALERDPFFRTAPNYSQQAYYPNTMMSFPGGPSRHHYYHHLNTAPPMMSYWPVTGLSSTPAADTAEVKNDKNKFQVKMNVMQFKPEELTKAEIRSLSSYYPSPMISFPGESSRHHYYHHMNTAPPMMSYWPVTGLSSTPAADTAEVKNDKDKFQVKMNVMQFKPEELTVSTADKQLTVEGKHEERGDEHGAISRHFLRKYVLPDDVDPASISSNITPDGALIIEAMKKGSALTAGERKIPIQMGSHDPNVGVLQKDRESPK